MRPGPKPFVLTEELQFWIGAVPDVELARLAGVSREKIGQWRRDLGRPPAPRELRNFERKRRVADLLVECQSTGKVARMLRMTRQHVHNIACEMGVKKMWVAQAQKQRRAT